MRKITIRQIVKYGILALLCLFLFPIFPLVLGIYLAIKLFKVNPNKKKAGLIATFVVIMSFFLSGITLSFFPTNKSVKETEKPRESAIIPSIVPTAMVITPTDTPVIPVLSASTANIIQNEQGSIVKVVDGDTVDVLINNKKERVRVIGINTPETVDPRKPVECFGIEASNRAKSLLPIGTVVELEADPTQANRDSYDRLLRYLKINGIEDFGLKLIADGFAYEYTFAAPYKYQNEYKQAQKNAETASKGLWSEGACTITPSPTIKKIVNTPQPKVLPLINTANPSCTGPDLDCSDFKTHSEAKTFFDSCGFTADNDPMRLDSVGVGDGVPCESLP